MLEAYGAYGTKMLYGKETVGVIRSTFVISPEGTLERAYYGVKATGHVARLRKDLGAPTDSLAAKSTSLAHRGPVGKTGSPRGRSPTAEAQDLGSCQCGFESHRPHLQASTFLQAPCSHLGLTVCGSWRLDGRCL